MNGQVAKKKYIFKYLLLILIAICLLFSALSSTFYTIASADSVDYYSSALEDLVKDSNFKATDYVEDVDDTSLHVLQIAESSNKELFVYVYLPSATEYFQASSINISTAINDSLKYENYKLEYLNSNGVFFKYKVVDFVVSNQVVRYYDISSIYRPYYDSVDEDVHENENTKNEKAYAVAKLFTAITNDDGVHYYCSDTQVIEVTNKYVSYITQEKKFEVAHEVVFENCNYVAFSANIDIDRLFEADVSYVSRVHYRPFFGAESYSEPKNEQVTIKYTEVMENPNPNVLGFKFGRQYKWNRIETVEHFIANTELDDDEIVALQDKQWVLWFTESDQVYDLGGISITEISEVTILRLKFETDGVVYNLGVVDNKQSHDYTPQTLEGFWGWLTGFISVLLVIIVVVILLVTCGPQVFVWIGKAIWAVLKFIAMCIVYIFKGLWWLVTMPFEIFKKEK